MENQVNTKDKHCIRQQNNKSIGGRRDLAEKDLTEKYLESFSDVFADIHNVLLFQEELIREEELEDGPTESTYKAEEGNVRNQFRDTS